MFMLLIAKQHGCFQKFSTRLDWSVMKYIGVIAFGEEVELLKMIDLPVKFHEFE